MIMRDENEAHRIVVEIISRCMKFHDVDPGTVSITLRVNELTTSPLIPSLPISASLPHHNHNLQFSSHRPHHLHRPPSPQSSIVVEKSWRCDNTDSIQRAPASPYPAQLGHDWPSAPSDVVTLHQTVDHNGETLGKTFFFRRYDGGMGRRIIDMEDALSG